MWLVWDDAPRSPFTHSSSWAWRPATVEEMDAFELFDLDGSGGTWWTWLDVHAYAHVRNADGLYEPWWGLGHRPNEVPRR